MGRPSKNAGSVGTGEKPNEAPPNVNEEFAAELPSETPAGNGGEQGGAPSAFPPTAPGESNLSEKPDSSNEQAAPPPPPKAGKKRRIQNPGKKNMKLIVRAALVEFDAEGIVELDADGAEYLLSIPGYKEI